MIDTINSLNTSTFNYKSIIIGGSGAAPVPDHDQTQTLNANAEIIKYLREKNPLQGIYYTFGPNDVYPPNYQTFSST
jgi:hypothetical protein